MAKLPIVKVEDMPKKGTQLKLILTLSDGTKMLFKPMRLSPIISFIYQVNSLQTRKGTEQGC